MPSKKDLYKLVIAQSERITKLENSMRIMAKDPSNQTHGAPDYYNGDGYTFFGLDTAIYAILDFLKLDLETAPGVKAKPKSIKLVRRSED